MASRAGKIGAAGVPGNKRSRDDYPEINIAMGLIRFLQPSEVVTISMNDDGAAEATRADELDLEKWLEEYTLDEVWQMGRMGARP